MYFCVYFPSQCIPVICFVQALKMVIIGEKKVPGRHTKILMKTKS